MVLDKLRTSAPCFRNFHSEIRGARACCRIQWAATWHTRVNREEGRVSRPSSHTTVRAGLAYGGSSGCPVAAPGVVKTAEAEGFPVLVGQCPGQYGRFCDPPVSLAGHAPLSRFARWDAEPAQVGHAGARFLPFLPPDLARPAHEPLVQFRDKNIHFPPAAAFTHWPLRWHGLHHLLLAYLDQHAFYAVRVPRCRDLPPVSFPPHLAVTQLPLARS